MKSIKQATCLAVLSLSAITLLKAQEVTLPYNPKTDYDPVIALIKDNEKNLTTDSKMNVVEIAKKMLSLETCKPYVYKKSDKTIGCILPSVGMGMAMIQMVAMDKEYQGKGYGTKFLHEVLQDFQKTHGVKLVTLATGNGADHVAARKLYERAGFKKLDMTPFLSALSEQQKKEILSTMEKTAQYQLIFDGTNSEKATLKNESKEQNNAISNNSNGVKKNV